MPAALPRMLAAFGTAVAFIALPALADENDQSRWIELKPALFGDRAIVEDDGLVVLDAPTRAYDAAVVPISVALVGPQTEARHVTAISLVIDHNPAPLAAVFHLAPGSGIATIHTRVRIDEYTHVRAIAELNDGSLHMVSRYVKAAGGCSSPSMKDQDVALQRLGTQKFRQMADLKADGTTEAQLMISHPNYSGLQMDQITRHYIPPLYVREIKVAFADHPVMTIDSDISLSEDPTIRFSFAASKPGDMSVVVTDTNDKTFTGRWPIAARVGS